MALVYISTSWTGKADAVQYSRQALILFSADCGVCVVLTRVQLYSWAHPNAVIGGVATTIQASARSI